MRFPLFWGFILLMIVSCTSNIPEHNIYHNENIEEIITLAQDKNQPFCVVLIDSLHMTANEYINAISKCKILQKGVLFNFISIDLNENKWYSKLLAPQIYPVSCIFSPKGELIDLVPGISNESVAYINQVITTKQPCLEFHYNQKYDKDKIEIIHYTNDAIKLKSKIEEGQYVINKIDSMLQITEHPYLLYLKLHNQIQFNNKIEAKETAKKLLLFDSPQILFEYYDELLVANQIIDSTYNAKTAPLISSISNKIELPNCEINHTYNLNIEIINEGEKPLKISDILTSCSCVELKSNKKHIVNSGESLIFKVLFTPDALGDVFREVYVASNSLNTPIYSISINANVK